MTDAARRSVLASFVSAIQRQDKAALLALVAEGVSWASDGGGNARAARKVFCGRDRVVRFVLSAIGRNAPHLDFDMTTVSGEAAIALRAAGKLYSVITVRTDDVQLLDVYTVLNPNKLIDTARAGG